MGGVVVSLCCVFGCALVAGRVFSVDWFAAGV